MRLSDAKRFPFQNGIHTFLATPVREDRPLAFLGLPYDAATTYRSGARMGPQAIRVASQMLTDGEHPEFETDPALVISDWGDAAIPYVRQEHALVAIKEAVAALLGAGRHPLLAGGDHSVTLGALRALSAQHGEALACIHFDAHCDTWPDHFGDKTGHGTWTRNAVEEGLIDPKRTVQIGIRSPVDRATKRWLPDLGGMVLSARAALHAEPWGVMNMILRHLGPGCAERPTFISFDIDALDPAYAPGTGTPEAGGLSTAWALNLLERLNTLNLVGMDVVEVLPDRDQSEITALAAATLLWTYAAMHPAAKAVVPPD